MSKTALFLTDPRFEDISEGSTTQKLKLLAELRVYSAFLDASIYIPSGFEFEESIPTLLFSLSRPRGESKRAACVHDWLYRHKSYTNPLGTFPITRAQADSVYYELLKLKGVTTWRAYIRWLGVRAGGWTSWK